MSTLILIDIQDEWKDENIQIQFPYFPDNIKKLLETARSNNIDIIHVRSRYSGNEDWQNTVAKQGSPKHKINDISALNFAKEISNESLFLKSSWDIFENSQLIEYLKIKKSTKIVIAGMLTSESIHHSAYSGTMKGYEIGIVYDCCADKTLDRHNAVKQLYGGQIYGSYDVN